MATFKDPFVPDWQSEGVIRLSAVTEGGATILTFIVVGELEQDEALTSSTEIVPAVPTLPVICNSMN